MKFIASTNSHLAVVLMSIGFLVATLLGCADSDLTPELGPTQEGDNVGLCLDLRISLDGVSPTPKLTRTKLEEEDGVTTTRGTEFENTIYTITIFLHNLDDQSVSYTTLNSSTYSQLPFTATSAGSILRIEKKFPYISYARYNIYVAANLSPRQRDEFKAEILNSNQYYILPGNHMNIAADITSNENGMAMSCTQKDEFVFSEAEYAEGLNDSGRFVHECQFSMRRIAAKLLVVAKTTDDNNKYIVVDKEEGQEQKFLVKLDDVSFNINTVNKHTYLFQKSSEDKPYYYIDPNNSLAAGEDIEEQFVYNPIYSWSNYTAYFKKVKPYVKSKHDNNENLYQFDNDYPSCIYYLPENTFSVPSDMNDIDPEKQVTHVIIRAKIIPLTLKVKKGLKAFAENQSVGTELYNLIAAAEETATTEVYTIHCKSETFSQLICELSLRYEGYYGAISNTTFFMKDNDLYTYSAAKYEAQGENYVKGSGNTLKLTGFEIYDNGYANYKVYVNDPKLPLDNDNKWKSSQILRNTYYILCIDKISAPGQGFDPKVDYIQMHTKVAPYIDSWKGVINITDETPSNP